MTRCDSILRTIMHFNKLAFKLIKPSTKLILIKSCFFSIFNKKSHQFIFTFALFSLINVRGNSGIQWWHYKSQFYAFMSSMQGCTWKQVITIHLSTFSLQDKNEPDAFSCRGLSALSIQKHLSLNK